jgi:hypothetical protein
MTTLTTVGYGDICPANDVERMYELGALLITALIFATLLSTISELVAKVDSQAALADEKIEAARDFMNYYKMPRELRAKASRASSQRYCARLRPGFVAACRAVRARCAGAAVLRVLLLEAQCCGRGGDHVVAQLDAAGAGDGLHGDQAAEGRAALRAA